MKILFAWEMGDGFGHLQNLVLASRHPRLAEHEHVFAIPPGYSPEAVATRKAYLARELPGATILVAPQPVAHDVDHLRRDPTQPWRAKSFRDVLLHMGHGDDSICGYLSRWFEILAQVEPDVILAESAPGLIRANQSVTPSVAFGTPYALSPRELPLFPGETGNSALRGRLPDLFTADRTIPLCYPMLDPYAPRRDGPLAVGPAVPGVRLPAGWQTGSAHFAYLDGAHPHIHKVLEALRDAPFHTRAYVKSFNPNGSKHGNLTLLPDFNLRTELKYCGRVIHHGSLGIAHAALAAGLPQFVFPFHLENELTAGALIGSRIGVATGAPSEAPETYADRLAAPFDEQREEALGAAEYIASRSWPGLDAVADAVMGLVNSIAGKRSIAGSKMA